MTSVVSNNYDDTILQKLAIALAEVTSEGLPVFEDVSVSGSRDEATDKDFTDSPIASVSYATTDTHNIPDQEVGCVLRCEVLVAVKADTPALRSRELTRCVNSARNALESNIPSTANGFGEDGDGEYHPRLRVGTPERVEAEDPWAIAWLPVEVAYRTTTRTTH